VTKNEFEWSSLPASWCLGILSDIGSVASGGTPSTKDDSNFSSGDIPWITPADLSKFNGKLISNGERFISKKGLNSSSAVLLPAGTVLFSSRAPIGYVAIAANPVTTNQGFKNITLRDGIFNEYVFYYLKASKRLAESNASGTTFLEISGSKFSQLPIPIAPLVEQRRIVAKIEELFTKLDAGVVSLKAAKKQLKRYRQSVLKAAVEGELTREWREKHKEELEPASVLLERILKERRAKWEADQLAKMQAQGKPPKDDKWKAKYQEPTAPDVNGLKQLPVGWIWAMLIQLGFVVSGQTPKGIDQCRHTQASVPWFRVGDMNRSGNERVMNSAEVNLHPSEAISLGINIQPAGTIIFPKRGGAIATNKKRVLAKPSAYDLNTMGITPMPQAANYLWWWFTFIDLSKLSDGSNVPQINHSDIEPLLIPLPPLTEQVQIVAEVERRLSVADEIEATLDAELKRAERLRQSILKRAFEGKLVPQDPNDEPASALLERIREERRRPVGDTPTKGRRNDTRITPTRRRRS